jgi:zinc/manganese transport system permease protein
LFGSIYGLDAAAARVAVLVAVGVLAVGLAITRPLLFASLDEAVADARGVPVRGLGYVFLALVGATAAEATQAVGALLILGLLAGPAGIAVRITTRPYRAIALATTIAIAAMWGGLILSYAAPKLPPSFAILAVITVTYLGAVGLPALRGRLTAPNVA